MAGNVQTYLPTSFLKHPEKFDISITPFVKPFAKRGFQHTIRIHPIVAASFSEQLCMAFVPPGDI